jgi:hypothetical protein
MNMKHCKPGSKQATVTLKQTVAHLNLSTSNSAFKFIQYALNRCIKIVLTCVRFVIALQATLILLQQVIGPVTNEQEGT